MSTISVASFVTGGSDTAIRSRADSIGADSVATSSRSKGRGFVMGLDDGVAGGVGTSRYTSDGADSAADDFAGSTLVRNRSFLARTGVNAVQKDCCHWRRAWTCFSRADMRLSESTIAAEGSGSWAKHSFAKSLKNLTRAVAFVRSSTATRLRNTPKKTQGDGELEGWR